MKYTTERNGDHELAALALLNQDLNRTDYPAIKPAPSTRNSDVSAALKIIPNVFELCRAATKLARNGHNPRNSRFTESLTWAFHRIAEQTKRKPVSASLAESKVA